MFAALLPATAISKDLTSEHQLTQDSSDLEAATGEQQDDLEAATGKQNDEASGYEHSGCECNLDQLSRLEVLSELSNRHFHAHNHVHKDDSDQFLAWDRLKFW